MSERRDGYPVTAETIAELRAQLAAAIESKEAAYARLEQERDSQRKFIEGRDGWWAKQLAAVTAERDGDKRKWTEEHLLWNSACVELKAVTAERDIGCDALDIAYDRHDKELTALAKERDEAVAGVLKLHQLVARGNHGVQGNIACAQDGILAWKEALAEAEQERDEANAKLAKYAVVIDDPDVFRLRSNHDAAMARAEAAEAVVEAARRRQLCPICCSHVEGKHVDGCALAAYDAFAGKGG